MKNLKNEKGAIALFTLISCLFFVFILSGLYIANLNQLQMQEREIKIIQENYAREIDRVDEIYEDLAN